MPNCHGLYFLKNSKPSRRQRRKDLGELHAGPAACLTEDAADRSLCAGAGMGSSGPACPGLNGGVLSLPELPAVSRLPRPTVWPRCTQEQRRLAGHRPFAANPARFHQPRDLFFWREKLGLRSSGRLLAGKREGTPGKRPLPLSCSQGISCIPTRDEQAMEEGRERKRYPHSQKSEAAFSPSALGSVR